MFATNPSLMVVYCHVVTFAETMDRDLEKEELLGDIIRNEGDITLSFHNDIDGQEGDHDGSGDRTEEGALTVAKSGEVYIHILIKPLLI